MSSNIFNITLEAAELFAYQSSILIVSALFCIPAYIFNILMIIVITKSKTFHTKSHFIVVALCVSEICLTLANQYQAIQRFLIYYSCWLIRISQLLCITQTFFQNVTSMVVENFTLALSIDRFIALMYPIFYKNFDLKSYLIIFNACSWGYGSIMGFVSYIGYQTQKILPVCLFANTYELVYYDIFFVQSDLKMALTIAFDFAAVLVLWRRLRLTRQLPLQQRREARINLELGTMRTIIVIEIVHFVCVAIITLRYISHGADLAFKIKIAPALNIFMIFNSILHLFVYLSMSKTFKQAFLETFSFCCNRNLVQHIPSGHT